MVSKKCEEALKAGFTGETCGTKAVRRIVMCRAVNLRETKGMKYGDSIRAAWKEAKESCAKFK